MQRPPHAAGPGTRVSGRPSEAGGRANERKEQSRAGAATHGREQKQGFTVGDTAGTRPRRQGAGGRHRLSPASSDGTPHVAPGPRGTFPAPTLAPASCGPAPRRGRGGRPCFASGTAHRHRHARANAARPRRRRSFPDRLTTRPRGPGRFLQQGSFLVSRASFRGRGPDTIRTWPAVMRHASARQERCRGAKECTT
jgi:hypothetical protein